MSEETVDAKGTGTAAEALPDKNSVPNEAEAKSAPEAQSQQSAIAKRHLRKTRIGEVVSNKMDKTIVIAVVRRVPHAKFGKIVQRTKKLYAHDEENKCAVGDLVRVEETRPLSRLKRWRLVEVLRS
jgi:small subunit ribosomal protein S17